MEQDFKLAVLIGLQAHVDGAEAAATSEETRSLGSSWSLFDPVMPPKIFLQIWRPEVQESLGQSLSCE